MLQVAGYVQHFNLSKALASSSSKFCAWISTALLLCLLLPAILLQRSSNAGLSEVHQALATAQTPVLVVATAAAVLLIVSVPLAGKLANERRRQDQKRGNVSQQMVARPSVSQTVAIQGTTADERGQQLGDARKMSNADSQPAASGASSHTAASTVDAEPMLSALQQADDSSAAQPVSGEAPSVAPDLPGLDAASAPQQQPPASDTSGDVNVPDRKHGGFFRDVSTDCVPQLKSYHRQRRRWFRGNRPYMHTRGSNANLQPCCRQVMTSLRFFV